MTRFEEINAMLEKIKGGTSNLFGVDVDPNAVIDCKQQCTSIGCDEIHVGTIRGEYKGSEYPTPPGCDTSATGLIHKS